MHDLKKPTTVVSKLGYRQAHVSEEGSRPWISLTAGSCCLPGETGANQEVLVFFQASFCEGRHSLSWTTVLLVATY